MTYGSKSSRDSPRRQWNTWWMKRGWETWCSLRKRRVSVDLIAISKYLTKTVEKKPDSSWRCTVEEAWKQVFEHEKFLLDTQIFGIIFFLLPWKWLNIGTARTDRLQNFHSWGYLKLSWIQSWATSSSWRLAKMASGGPFPHAGFYDWLFWSKILFS